MTMFTSSAIQLLLGAVTIPGALSVDGYCNWGPDGSAATSTCNGDVQGGQWCNLSEYNCDDGCSGRWCTSGTGGPPSPTPPTTPTPGVLTATTTRYWDCSGGSCACSFVPTGFGDDKPVHCHSNAMFTAPDNNDHGAKFYGAAAISNVLGGGNWLAEGCGKCWKVTGTSSYTGEETTLVLKGTNYCPPGNPMCNGKPHFDIAAPGFDVLAYSFAHSCPDREPEEAEGFAACSEWLIGSNSDPDQNCNCAAFTDLTLRRGCENFYSLKWDNTLVVYEELTDCPNELAELHCESPYEGLTYATEENMPETCASNDFSTSGTTTVPPVTTTTTASTSTTTTTSTTTPPATTQPPPTTTTSTTTTSEATSTTPEATTTTPQTTTTTPQTTTTSTTTTPQTTTTSTTTTTTTTTVPPATTTPSSSSFCCSWDYASCEDNDWCNASEENCMGSCGGRMYMKPTNTCVPLWGDCTENRNGCCNPLGTVRCKGNSGYRQCLE